MMRHLFEALKVRTRIPGIGRVPLQPLLLLAAVGLAIGVHPIAGAAALVAQGLFTIGLARTPAFHKWVRARDVEAKLSRREDQRQKLIERLEPERRDRLFELSKVYLQIEELHAAAPDLPLQTTSHLHSLEQLQWLYLKLLIGQQMLSQDDRSDEARKLRRECRRLSEDLELRDVPDDVRKSKAATLELLRRRLDAIRQRGRTLQRIESDLLRIEASMGLALEHAALDAHPPALTDHVELSTRTLDDHLFQELESTVHELDESFGTVPRPQAQAG